MTMTWLTALGALISGIWCGVQVRMDANRLQERVEDHEQRLNALEDQ